jgi:hypothetical protein
MLTMSLYIIGNGFDIYHQIKSRYTDFKNYVEINDKELFDTLDNYFDSDDLWSDFEETLAYIDIDTITDDAENYLVSYGSDEWSEADNHNYPDAIQTAIEIVTVQLKEHFTHWIIQLHIPNVKKLVIDKKSMYLTFNYTSTLEKIYNIDTQNILYVHNKAIDINSLLVLGHSRKPSTNGSYSKNDDEDIDVRVAQGSEILDKYFKDTYKDTETIIQENQDYFAQLSDINEIFVLGHSISPVDISYFKEIKQQVSADTNWIVSYYGAHQKVENKNKIVALGVDEKKIKMITLDEIKIK